MFSKAVLCLHTFQYYDDFKSESSILQLCRMFIIRGICSAELRLSKNHIMNKNIPISLKGRDREERPNAQTDCDLSTQKNGTEVYQNMKV